jgi:hypothetical protein
MYRLFSRITRGLDPIADCFKEHVESEGMKLVKEVAEAVEAKKEKDAGMACVLFCAASLVAAFVEHMNLQRLCFGAWYGFRLEKGACGE